MTLLWGGKKLYRDTFSVNIPRIFCPREVQSSTNFIRLQHGNNALASSEDVNTVTSKLVSSERPGLIGFKTRLPSPLWRPHHAENRCFVKCKYFCLGSLKCKYTNIYFLLKSNVLWYVVVKWFLYQYILLKRCCSTALYGLSDLGRYPTSLSVHSHSHEAQAARFANLYLHKTDPRKVGGSELMPWHKLCCCEGLNPELMIKILITIFPLNSVDNLSKTIQWFFLYFCYTCVSNENARLILQFFCCVEHFITSDQIYKARPNCNTLEP